MKTVLLSMDYQKTRALQNGVCTLIDLPLLELKLKLTRSHFTAEQTNHYAAGAEV